MSRTIRTCPRRHIKVPDGQIWWKCKCDWCLNTDRKRQNKIYFKQEINRGYEEHISWYDEDPTLEYWLENYFPSWEEEIWEDHYINDYYQQKDLDRKIPFGILQQELLWALHQGS